MEIHTGEIYGKQTPSKFVMYSVLKVGKNAITLQNIDNPLSLFETTAQKLQSSGYNCVSHTPYIDIQAKTSNCRKALRKPSRCPYTLDFLENRADEVSDLFSVVHG